MCFFNRGNSRAESKDYEDAIQDYTAAITLNPNSPQYYFNRGNAYTDLYRFEIAIIDYDQVTGHLYSSAAYNKGNSHLALRHLPDAMTSYQLAIDNGENQKATIHNMRTLSLILQLLDGSNFHLNADPDPNSGNLRLEVVISANTSETGQELYNYSLSGRIGNMGNDGGQVLPGGFGFQGKPAVPIVVHWEPKE